MGCDSSKPSVKSSAKQEEKETVDYKDVEDENPDYPPAYIPETTKAEIWDDEVNVYIQDRIDNMPAGTDSSYKSLLKYLSEGATKETQHVTAIYLWMKCQDYQNESLDQREVDKSTQRSVKRAPGGKDLRVEPVNDEPPDTPRGYMKMIKDGNGDFTSFFAILCRRSGIPCNILRGLGKDEQFYIGMPEQHMASKWTAVYADQEWRLAHIQWAMENRTDNNQNHANNQNSDFFFLIDPDIFAHYCQPDDFNWQLLDRPYSKKEFLSMPNYRPASFLTNMAVISPKTSTTKTSKSATDIEISFPKKVMEDIEVSYVFKFHQELVSTHRDGMVESKSKPPKNLAPFVFVNRSRSKILFEIQIPAAGKYLFDIYAKHVKKANKEETPTKDSKKVTKNAFERLVQFRLVSELGPEEGDVEPLPDCPDNGWGPGPTCRQLGLVPLTHFDSYIFIKPGEFRDIRFRMTRHLDVQCQLTHNYLPIYELVEQIEQEFEKDEVHIKVKIPEEGTYALKIYCRLKGTKEYEEACVYLLKQQVKSRLPENFERGYRRKHRDKMLRSRLEYHIENHTREQDLQDALETYHCYNVPDHGEVKRGKEKLKHYWEVKRELNSATRGKNIRNIRKWIERANRSKYKDDLQEDIRKAEFLEQNISKRKGYAHPIARMDEHTITEIHNYKHPPNVVHDVMKSTYLLLGEDKDYLDIWEQIQYLMGRKGKQGLKNLILNRRVEDVSPYQADEAEAVIAKYSLDKCRAVSSEIGSFYKWCCQFIMEIRQHQIEEHKRVEELYAAQVLARTMTAPDDLDASMMSEKSVSLKGISPEPQGEDNQISAGIIINGPKHERNTEEKTGIKTMHGDQDTSMTNNGSEILNKISHEQENQHEKKDELDVSINNEHIEDCVQAETSDNIVEDEDEGLLVLNMDKKEETNERNGDHSHPFEISDKTTQSN